MCLDPKRGQIIQQKLVFSIILDENATYLYIYIVQKISKIFLYFQL